MIVSLPEMLEARERRAIRQRELLCSYRRPMISFTMNIAGPIKDTPLIRRGFEIGLRDLEQLLAVEGIPVRCREVTRAFTGCEAMLVTEGNPARLKALTQELENAAPLGRLFDMDVLDETGEKLQRAEPRRCLICGQVAQVCGRSRTHSVEELQKRTKEILSAAVLEEDRGLISRLAQQALLYEVAVTPKPGLVDRENNGSHRDMDFFTFQRSALALGPYFADCFQIGCETARKPAGSTFQKLRFPGIRAEGRMLAATGGVNTHKGAIFSLGILCGALGRLPGERRKEPETILKECGEMTRAAVQQELEEIKQGQGGTAGQRLYREYGITGVRGQAAAGFPEVLQIGLPKLEEGLRQGRSLNDAACGALLALIGDTVDTNMIHRGGIAMQREMARQVNEMLKETPFPTQDALAELNARFVEKNLSPGGCADLLAMTLMLYFLKEGE